MAELVVIGYDGRRGWLHPMAVRGDPRRQGVGTALGQAAEARLRDLGCVKINLQIRAMNVTVAKFYQGLGYQVEELISMGKRLDTGTPAAISDTSSNS